VNAKCLWPEDCKYPACVCRRTDSAPAPAAPDAIEAGERMSQALTKRDLIALGAAADEFDAAFKEKG
jgi:hypothetical protein